MFEGFVKVELKAPEEFLVVWSSFSQKLLGHLLGPLLLERVTCRASLHHLVLDKGLLSQDLAPVLPSQIGGAPEKALGHLDAFIVKSRDVCVRRAVRCGPAEHRANSAGSLHFLLLVSVFKLLIDGYTPSEPSM